MFGASILEPHLDSGLIQTRLPGQLLAMVDIGIMARTEGLLQVAQLFLRERGAMSASGGRRLSL